MSSAIVQTGGKQYLVTQGMRFAVEKLEADVDANVEFDKVLMISGEHNEVGKPFVAGAKVVARVLEHKKGKKIRIIKFKRRKHYRRTYGHRQLTTVVEVVEITKG